MITYDLERRPITLEELLRLADEDAIRVIRIDGQEFIDEVLKPGRHRFK
jgi:hypothetical protein